METRKHPIRDASFFLGGGNSLTGLYSIDSKYHFLTLYHLIDYEQITLAFSLAVQEIPIPGIIPEHSMQFLVYNRIIRNES